MSRSFLFSIVIAFVVLLSTVSFANDVSFVTVTSSNPLAFVDRAPLPEEKFLSTARFSDAVEHQSNFGTLYVKTSSSFSDDDQMFAAGFAEGYLNAERIYQHFFNMKCQVDCSGKQPEDVANFFSKQDTWVRSQVAKNPSCSYWQFVGSLVKQLDGLVDGYARSAFGKENPLELWAFVMINAMGDLFDIIPAVSRSKRPDFHRMNHKEIRDYMNRNGHCSALIRVTDDLSDIMVGHNSWFVYSSMLRIYKTYEFDLRNKNNHAVFTSFSSYPASLSSLDDFYMMAGSDLIMTQTTNNIFNATLWDLVTPESLLGMTDLCAW